MAVIIMDFDGTIADSFEYVASFLERHVRHGHPLTVSEKETLRGQSMVQMALYLGSPRWKLPLLFLVGRRAMGRAIYDVPLFAGMGKVIEQLHAEGHELLIVSSNNSRNIRRFLKQHHLYTFFTDMYGGAGFFGKRRAIRTILWRNHLKAETAVYIGDEVRDIDAARAAGVRIISVSWGFDKPALIAEHNPSTVAGAPADIIRILEEL